MKRPHAKKTARQRKASCKHRLIRHEKYRLVCQLAVVIRRRLPELLPALSQLPDTRKRPHYQVNDLMVGGLMMFLFRQGSRNQADGAAKNLDYQDNVRRLLGVRVADMDTVDRFLRQLPPDRLEEVKRGMIRALVESKTLSKHKFNGEDYMLAVDGTGLQSFDHEPYPGCPFREYRSGRKVWTAQVLEAKIVGSNGFALSLATEWVENPAGVPFDKQDCESKAFKRMAGSIRKHFPRLPLVILLDGLYPNDPVLTICNQNGWKAIITLKDSSLKGVQEQISDLRTFHQYDEDQRVNRTATHWHNDQYKVFNNLDHKGHTLAVVEAVCDKQHHQTQEKETTRFVHIANFPIDRDSAHLVSQAGRRRWKIENEGFNTQKNTGYNLTHKYSRNDFTATKNYYQLLQIADVINQLTYLQKAVQQHLDDHGLSVKCLIGNIMSYLKSFEFTDEQLLASIIGERGQTRY